MKYIELCCTEYDKSVILTYMGAFQAVVGGLCHYLGPSGGWLAMAFIVSGIC